MSARIFQMAYRPRVWNSPSTVSPHPFPRKPFKKLSLSFSFAFGVFSQEPNARLLDWGFFQYRFIDASKAFP
ncbi:hypothetical protein F11_15330 [Rhodospirillum rubrum F11]|nr:hypothetical protein F11_15330 [Rhodospirillum rubrum F11]